MTIELKPSKICRVLAKTKADICELGSLKVKEGGKRSIATRITKSLEAADRYEALMNGTNDETQKQQFLDHYNAYIQKVKNVLIKATKSDTVNGDHKKVIEVISKKLFKDFDVKKAEAHYKPLRPLSDDDKLIKLEDLNKNLTISTKKQEKPSIWMPLIGGLLGGAVIGGIGVHSLSKPKADAVKTEDKAAPDDATKVDDKAAPADSAKPDDKAASADSSDKKA